MAVSNPLAIRLRVLRAERRATLRDVEEATGVAKETLSDLERGRRRPKDVTLAKLADFYGIPMEELLELEEPALPKSEAPRGTGRPAEENREDPGFGAPTRRVYLEPIQEPGQPERYPERPRLASPGRAPERVEHLQALEELILYGHVKVVVVEEDGSWSPFSVEEVRETGIGPYLQRVIDGIVLAEGQTFMLAFSQPRKRSPEYSDARLAEVVEEIAERRPRRPGRQP